MAEPKARRLENSSFLAYHYVMDKLVDNTPPGWAEILDESLAEIHAGLLVSREEVHLLFREAEARHNPKSKAGAPQRRAPIDH